MYLKKLESLGFKSFAERISIEFVPGVTAVVGPNGSGKSNITDAIRWVLGEQSVKSLRGSKMEDIIFQGSDTRKALNVAEVTLVLDNKDKALPLDYEEVSVTRRVYRSGESEFYINKQSCRLKDIIDLFMDSGLGREAFSIISQGKVEEILSSKAEERRTIFEEAAGVLKYKQRKKKSEYKLAETQENLNRVEDILHEIESQLGPLEEQKNTASQYLTLKDRLKEKEISLLIAEIETLHEQWKTMKQVIESENEKHIILRAENQEKEAWIEEQKKKNLQLDEQIEELQGKLLLSTEQLEKLEGKKQLLSERSKHHGENRQKLLDDREQTESELKKTEEELKKEEEKRKSFLVEIEAIKESIKELETTLSRTEETIAEQIEELKSEYIELLNEQAASRNELQSIERQSEQYNNKNQRQAERFKASLEEREKLEQVRDKVERERLEQLEIYEASEKKIKQLKIEVEANRRQFQDMQTKLYQGFQYIDKLKSKKEMLEEMKEDFQGFFHGVKAILKARKKGELKQIEGAVIELIEVPKSYILAIETVLGGQAQHIVVPDEQVARTAITWLKKTNNGRATFLPLTTIQERYIPRQLVERMNDHPGYVGTAAELVKTTPNYQRAVNHLMGHVIITETLKDANEIAGLTGRKYRIVTLEGDVVAPGGAMTGGASQKKNQSLFTREKELEELRDKLTSYEPRAASFAEKVEEQKRIMAEREQELKRKEQNLIADQQQLQALQSSSHKAELQLKSLNDSLSLYDQEEKQYQEDTEYLNQRKKELKEQLADLKRKLAEAETQIEQLTKEESAVKENRELLKEKYHEQKLLLAKQEERYRNQSDKVKNLKKQIDLTATRLKGNIEKLIELDSILENKETEESINASITEEKVTKETLTTSIQELRSERANRTQTINDEENELREENKRSQSMLANIQQQEVKMNRLDVELENRLTHLETEYTITFDKAKQTYEKTTDIQQSKKEVEQLKQQIVNLGTVNLGSIDEYERIHERYTFLTEQQTDLVDAKNTLYKVIAELDVEMIERFEVTFKAIKEEFGVVFKELFGGGKAELKLTNPNQMLETGVEIIAQPPGKKLQQLGLLSGGERALTAIALLFAILRVRPVPFCILDEVEAALDEANVTRFAKYVKLYSKQTQFIVITHRKGTMEEADVLYGVTMQESGVSRLVSVRLEETADLVES
ncbi:chromosome segregation protein SMC [Oceanobacillus alkalisoli]|uniref:chromosome segregation protein SMC n=1 Tax=Oceanobacillus alkalisoli TaxID=2925113 RepID=UPI001EF0BA5E|nr:chromosome segregation protein SMC [Oceanobacillus alkalisoli]MCF3942462.1 chromosome segregation protein SMC [Oceanobacillus alkalisoli]MCG5103519.1 chromosome segregation protein SMC [Oceanobacillus alkalisoli]